MMGCETVFETVSKCCHKAPERLYVLKIQRTNVRNESKFGAVSFIGRNLSGF